MCQDCIDAIAATPEAGPNTITVIHTTPKELEQLFQNNPENDLVTYGDEYVEYVKFAGEYYSFGETKKAKKALTDLVKSYFTITHATPGEIAEAFPPSAPFTKMATAGDMTDADVLPKAGVVVGSPEYETIFANQPTELESDIHESATVENTNTLIADLEEQNRELTGMVREDIETFKQVIEKMESQEAIIGEQRRGVKALALAFRSALRLLDKTKSQRDNMRSDNVKLLAECDSIRDYTIGLVLRLVKTKLANAELFDQTVRLNAENERLRATIDFLKRPFYERWAISLKARMMSFAG